MFAEFLGPGLIAIAALLWATDALFRLPTVNAIDPTLIVFFEHVVGVLILFPWVFLKRRKELFSLDAKAWTAAALIGVGGSAFGSVLFTASFRYVNPSVAILLQKVQPLLVIMMAFVFLNERPGKNFFLWAASALVAGMI